MRQPIPPFLIFGTAVARAASVSAHAAPILPVPVLSPSVTLVAQGCGPGGWRGPYGHCHYAPYRGGYYGPLPAVAPARRV